VRNRNLCGKLKDIIYAERVSRKKGFTQSRKGAKAKRYIALAKYYVRKEEK